MTRAALLAVACIAAVAAGACKREERGYRVQPPQAQRIETLRVSDLVAGVPPADARVHNDYEDNAYGMTEGKRLYTWFNCVGCHSNGGGGMGPPLMDAKWIYGSEPEQIFATIVQGRPNGMPSFRGKIADHQVWQLVAYVRSMSGNAARDASPARNDDIQARPAEQQTPEQPPVNSAPPPPP